MRQCPRCNVPFEPQRRTFAEIDTCPQCAGTFLDPGEGVTALGHHDDLRAVVDRGDAKLMGSSQLGCPTGHGPMTVYRFGDAESPVDVDVCNTCGGAFFDAGETEIIGDIQKRAGEVVRSSFVAPPSNGKTAQDSAIEAARREGGRSAFASFFSDLAGGLTGALARGGRRHHHHHGHFKGGGGGDAKGKK
jgi:Zn-finger nucleic acid-binding protein